MNVNMTHRLPSGRTKHNLTAGRLQVFTKISHSPRGKVQQHIQLIFCESRTQTFEREAFFKLPERNTQTSNQS